MEALNKNKKKIEREYRVVQFKYKSRTHKEKGYLSGIQELKKSREKDKIVISNWINHNKSLWINFVDYKGNSQVYDSGVIEQLYDEIQRLKKRRIKRDILDSLIVINHKGEFY